MFLFLVCLVIISSLIFFVFRQRKIKQQKEEIESQRRLDQQKRAEQKRKANRKGELGEFKIDFQFQSLPDEYKHLSDVMFKTTKGLTQIDHIVISPYGIFVVETKNYAGWIFGNQYDKYWTQTFPNKKNRFYNPIRQNYGHVQALKGILKGYKNLKFHPIIAFSGRCQLREIKSDIPVIFDTEISNVILRKNKEAYLSNSDVSSIFNILNEANITDENLRKEHIQHIKRKKANAN